MIRARSMIGAVGAVVLVVTLTGCGGGGDYCGTVEGTTDEFAELEQAAQPDAEMLENLSSSFSDAAGAAPDEIAEQWANLADAMQRLTDAGGDFENLDEEATEQFRTLEGDIDAIATFTLGECDIDLNAS